MVGHDKGMNPGFQEGRCEGVHSATKLVETSGFAPPGELTSDIRSVHGAGQEKSGLEHGLIPDDLEELLEFHERNMPHMACICNKKTNPCPENRRMTNSGDLRVLFWQPPLP